MKTAVVVIHSRVSMVRVLPQFIWTSNGHVSQIGGIAPTVAIVTLANCQGNRMASCCQLPARAWNQRNGAACTQRLAALVWQIWTQCR